MAFNDLLQSMEQSAEEKKKDILENARFSAEEILHDAEKKSEALKTDLVKEATEKVSVKKNKSLYLLKEEIKEELTREKERIFGEAFSAAAGMLETCRDDPRYAESFKRFLYQSLEGLKGQIVVHLDPRDVDLCNECRGQSGPEFVVSTDRECAGGVDAELADKGVIVRNTLESRLENARVLMRKELFGFLFGE